MTERPIIMQGWGVQEILDDRKTQTRRVIRPQPKIIESSRRWYWEKALDVHGRPLVDASRQWWEYYGTSPYGKPGDLLYVREAWRFIGTDMNRLGRTHFRQDVVVQYRSVPARRTIEIGWEEAEKWMARASRWRPSIHMPKWAARLWLRLTDVRVERVQDITSEDAQAEGCWRTPEAAHHYSVEPPEFRHVWDSINAKRGYGWDINPHCWVLTFETAPRGAREAT